MSREIILNFTAFLLFCLDFCTREKDRLLSRDSHIGGIICFRIVFFSVALTFPRKEMFCLQGTALLNEF